MNQDTNTSCHGCQWYNEWFGICCNGDSEYRGDISYKCKPYVGDEPFPGVED